MAITSAIILAGGQGTRLRDVVSDLPKPLAPINNKPFLEHLMSYWANQGINHFIISVGYKYKSIINFFGDKYKNVKIEYAIENEPLGTGGGLALALDIYDCLDPCLVLNGDTMFNAQLESIEKFHIKNKSIWTIALKRIHNTGRYLGIKVNEKGRILTLNQRKQSLINGGVYVIDPERIKEMLKNFPNKKISIEDELITKMVSKEEAIFGIQCEGFFIDIGIPEDYFKSFEYLN